MSSTNITLKQKVHTSPKEEKVNNANENPLTWEIVHKLAFMGLLELPLTETQRQIERAGGVVDRSYVDCGCNSRHLLFSLASISLTSSN